MLDDDDDDRYRDAALARDEVFGGRRRLRRFLVLAAVLGMTLVLFALVTMMRR